MCSCVDIVRVVVSIAATVAAVVSCASPRWVTLGHLEAGLWTERVLDTPEEIHWVQKMFVGGLIGTLPCIVTAIGAMVLANNFKYRENCIFSGAASAIMGGGCYMVGFSVFTYFINKHKAAFNLEYGVGYILCIVAWLLHWLLFAVFIVPWYRENRLPTTRVVYSAPPV